ncbi:MAG: serine/threonine protein kinase [Deltaproteobacteria bacterium]|nr:serine/threonine protein kinase [Deltaproteobacteria bacterium]
MRVGRYEVITHLATGGMAQIYLARQSGLGSFERHVVLKTILRERASDQRFVTMFLDEAKLAATLNHQNVAQVYEVDQADGAYFMAMEYVHGENARAILETTLRRGWTIPLELAVMIISGAAAGLHHAHERRGKNGQPLNIVHRDVSPANIMVGCDGSVKVLDFGIAKAEERATKTVGGTIKGKYGYMSPEQCKGKQIDRRSDIFALGICLYELTTLRRAFKGNDDFETMKRIVSGDMVLPSIAVPGYPRELEAIVLTALAGDPNARFQSGQELIEALDAFTVRAKLTGSNTAMGRFMTQLFGSKREPWIDGARPGAGEKTEITDGEDNEKTSVVEGRHDAGQQEPQQEQDASAWQQADQTSKQRKSAREIGRQTGSRNTPPPERFDQVDDALPTVPGSLDAIIPTPTFQGAPPVIRPAYANRANPPASKRSDEIRDVGAQPQPSGRGTRLSSDLNESDYKIDAGNGWLVVAIVVLLAVGGGIAAIMIWS